MNRPQTDALEIPLKSRQRLGRTPSWRLHALLLTFTAAVALCGAARSQITSAERAKRQVQLENMTEGERETLERQLAEWKRMPEVEREKYRSFYFALQSNGGLRDTFAAYLKWLESTSRPERDDLRSAKNSTERIVRMELLLDRQGESGNRISRIALPKFGDPHVLTREDYAAAMGVVEAGLKTMLPALARRLPNETIKRKILLEALLKKLFAGEEVAKQTLDAVIDVLGDERLKQTLKKMERPEQRLSRTYFLLVRSFAAEVGEHRPELKAEAGQRELEQKFLSLDPKFQDDLMRVPPDEFWALLLRKYTEEKNIADIPPPMMLIVRANVDFLPQLFKQMMGRMPLRPEHPKQSPIRGDQKRPRVE